MLEHPLALILSGLTGLILGLAYFVGLWWTVRELPKNKHPFRLLLFSMVLRIGIVLIGFYLVMAGDWKRLLAALFGFVLARLICLQWLGNLESKQGN